MLSTLVLLGALGGGQADAGPMLRASARVKPIEMTIPDPYRAKGDDPLPRSALRDCRSDKPVQAEDLARAVIEFNTEKIRYAGHAVVPLKDGAIPDMDLDGETVMPLFDAMQRTGEDRKTLAEGDCKLPVSTAHGGLAAVVAIDGGVPMSQVRPILQTARQATFKVVLLRLGDQQAPITRTEGMSTSKLGKHVEIGIDGRGLSLRVGDERTDLFCGADRCRREAELNLDGLQSALKAAIGEHQGTPVLVVPDSGVPWSSVLATMSAAASTSSGEPLAPNLILAGSATPTKHPAEWEGLAGLPDDIFPPGGAPVVRARLQQ